MTKWEYARLFVKDDGTYYLWFTHQQPGVLDRIETLDPGLVKSQRSDEWYVEFNRRQTIYQTIWLLLGDEGWELAAVASGSEPVFAATHVYVFKRPF